MRASLIAFFDFLIVRGTVKQNLAVLLPRLREPRPIPKALDRETLVYILKVAHAFGPEVYALVCVLGLAGLRLDETRCLRWSDWEGAWLHFYATKQRADRNLPLLPTVREALGQWKTRCPDRRGSSLPPITATGPLVRRGSAGS